MHDKNNKECKLGLIAYEPYKTHYVNSIAPTHQIILPCTCPQNPQQTANEKAYFDGLAQGQQEGNEFMQERWNDYIIDKARTILTNEIRKEVGKLESKLVYSNTRQGERAQHLKEAYLNVLAIIDKVANK